jgi:hypothetical protein
VVISITDVHVGEVCVTAQERTADLREPAHRNVVI